MIKNLSQNSWTYSYGLYDYVRLECTSNGHNKYYELHYQEASPSNTWKAMYGAIGAKGQYAEYTHDMWEVKIKEKLIRGYVIVQAVPRPSKPAIPINKDFLDKIELLIMILRAAQTENLQHIWARNWEDTIDEVLSIKTHYEESGKLEKQTMIRLNNIYAWISPHVPQIKTHANA